MGDKMDISTKIFFDNILGQLIITLAGVAFIISDKITVGSILILIYFAFNQYDAKHHLEFLEKEIELMKKKIDDIKDEN